MLRAKSKNKKNQQQTTFSELRGGGVMRLKSRNPQKTHLGPLFSDRIKFQLPDSIWRELTRGTNFEHTKTSTQISTS